MYKCVECGHLFEDGEQRSYSENVGECHGSPAYMSFSCCPVCGEDYEEARPCRICGSYQGVEYGEDFCENCKEIVLDRFTTLISKNFTPEETDVLRQEIEMGDLEL